MLARLDDGRQEEQPEQRLSAAPRNAVLQGECLDLLRTLPAACIDALVTDPPAGIGFMGKDWDAFRRRHNPADVGRDSVHGRMSVHAPHSYGESDRGRFIKAMTPIFEECLRVAKPGAYAFVWALPRTSHWTATALEDAGWEIRDVVHSLFATGFPKSLNLGEGRGTALKPAAEHWILCRKALDEPNVAAQVMATGTGALNIDACRVGTTVETWPSSRAYAPHQKQPGGLGRQTEPTGPVPPGRWPAHVLLSHAPDCRQVGTKRVKGSRIDTPCDYHGNPGAFGHAQAGPARGIGDADGMETVTTWDCVEGCPVAELDRQSGVHTSGKMRAGVVRRNRARYAGPLSAQTGDETYGDRGGASRFFPTFYYAPKASRSERDAALEGLPVRSAAQMVDREADSAGMQSPRAGAGRTSGARNHHPTVKNLDLMRWLCRLITPPGGLVLDCFCGSGSTLVAAQREGFDFLGMEREPDYVLIARNRTDLERTGTLWEGVPNLP